MAACSIGRREDADDGEKAYSAQPGKGAQEDPEGFTGQESRSRQHARAAG
jgi:hypothetical protein